MITDERGVFLPYNECTDSGSTSYFFSLCGIYRRKDPRVRTIKLVFLELYRVYSVYMDELEIEFNGVSNIIVGCQNPAILGSTILQVDSNAYCREVITGNNYVIIDVGDNYPSIGIKTRCGLRKRLIIKPNSKFYVCKQNPNDTNTYTFKLYTIEALETFPASFTIKEYGGGFLLHDYSIILNLAKPFIANYLDATSTQ